MAGAKESDPRIRANDEGVTDRDYEIAEEPGKDGPLLRMWYKGFR